MRPVVHELENTLPPSGVLARLTAHDHPVLLASGGEPTSQSRYSLLAAFPLLTFRALGAECEWRKPDGEKLAVQYGNPWNILREAIFRHESVDHVDFPFPLGGCFGYWGYDLKQFVEPRVRRRTINDLDLPDCMVGLYPSLMVWDHQAHKTWIIATGIDANGTRTADAAAEQVARWKHLWQPVPPSAHPIQSAPGAIASGDTEESLDREQFIRAVNRAQDYIRSGDIYQVNLSRRWSTRSNIDPVHLFHSLNSIAPAPFAGFMNWDDCALISSSPEQFLKLSGRHVITRPIKGTRPRSNNADEDARLSYELQSSEKERAELVMITDLLRNDIGRVCEFGSVHVPDLLKLERFSHVQHLVSTVEGRLRQEVSHIDALASCFPGGSITGAPKIRAMQIIEELEPVSRGPYTGCMGYIGFNRESQANILIRSAVVSNGFVHYHAGSGIVADSDPEAEFEETNIKARAFFQAMEHLGLQCPQITTTP